MTVGLSTRGGTELHELQRGRLSQNHLWTEPPGAGWNWGGGGGAVKGRPTDAQVSALVISS